MKKIIFCLLIPIAMLSCNQAPKTDDAALKRAEAKAIYDKNLSTLKSFIRAFENEQIDAWASTIDDNVVWNSAAYGAKAGTKEDWRKQISFFTTDWDSIKLKNPIFLPGIDTANYELDGAARYYGRWTGVHKSGVRTSVNYYAWVEFNKENKIISYNEFYDVGGLMNAVSGK